jgi:N-acetylmuramoyl-L-alanine amidase
MLDIKHIGSPNGWVGRKDAYGNEYKIEAIMLHVMDGFLYGCDAWFNNRESGVSAHYGVGGESFEEVHRYINEWDTAWHTGGNANGTWNFLGLPKDRPNFYTIGIEMQGGYLGQAIHEKTLNKTVELVSDICLRHSLPVTRERIIGHSDVNQVSRQNCPGIDLDKFVKRVVEYIAKLNPEPAWKLEVLTLDPKTFSPQNDYSLINLDNGQIVATYPKGTSVTVSYSYGDFYLTEYSFNK